MNVVPIILTAVFIILCAIAAYNIFSAVFRWPSGAATTALKTARGFEKEKLETKVILPLARTISPLFIMSEARKASMTDDLARMNINMTPQEYYARSFVLAMFFILIGIPFGLFIGSWAMAVFCILAILIFIASVNDDHNKIIELNRQIENELPRLVETLDYTMRVDRDLISFFNNYVLHAGPALKPELHKLVFELDSMDGEVALQRFAERLRIPAVISVVQVLIGIYQGIKQHDSLAELKNDMRTIKHENNRREIEKRPRKAMLIHLGMLLCVLLMMAAPFGLIAIQMFQTI